MNAPLQPNIFNLHALPIRCQQLIGELFQRTQVDPALLTMGLLVEVSGCAMGAYDVIGLDRQPSPLGLFGIPIMASGEGKSAMIGQLEQGRKRFEAEHTARHQAAYQDYLLDEQIWQTQLQGLEKQIRRYPDELPASLRQSLQDHWRKAPKPPRQIKLSYTNFTPEALVQNLAEHWPHAVLALDEASEFFNGRGTQGLTVLNNGYDGTDLDRQRCGERHGGNVVAPRMAALLALQPGALKRYLERRPGEARDLGFFARALIAFPSSMLGQRDFSRVGETGHLLPWLADRLYQLLTQSVDEYDHPARRQHLTFDTAATQRLRDLSLRIESFVAPNGWLSQAPDHAAKALRNLTRIAAVLHLIEHEVGLVIGESSVEAATSVMNYFTTEFLRLMVPPDPLLADAEAVYAWHAITACWGAWHGAP
ncbi:YfjI family protein [Chitiniphilus shinanonensis]|uniref:YfjI family protein n=1 Tax=Chitiniphilus shinanonensis TaxID=553088 RepID=UPI0030470CE6